MRPRFPSTWDSPSPATPRRRLTDATAYMAAQAGALADQVPRTEAGDMATDFSAMAKSAPSGYEALGKQYDFFQVDSCPG